MRPQLAALFQQLPSLAAERDPEGVAAAAGEAEGASSQRAGDDVDPRRPPVAAALRHPEAGAERQLAGTFGSGRPLAGQSQLHPVGGRPQVGDAYRGRDRGRFAAQQTVFPRGDPDRVDADRLRSGLQGREGGVEAVLGAGFAVLGGDVRARLGGDRAEFVFERPRRPGLPADEDADPERRRRRVGVEGPALDPHVAGLGAGQVEPADRVVFGGRQGRGSDGRPVDVVVVDVDRRAAVGLVVAAAVLVDALVPGPGVGGDDRVGGVLLPVPVGDPEVVGLDVVAADLGGEVGDPGGAAAVDAGEVAERVQLLGPGFEEGEGGGAALCRRASRTPCRSRSGCPARSRPRRPG